MVDTEGLRERKKQRTRRTLIDASYRLFGEKGYDRTTVAEIAAAAEVSTKTFFNYFPSKEDVLFADAKHRFDAAVRAINERGEDETPSDTLLRMRNRVVELLASTDHWLEPAVLAQRAGLVLTEPGLQPKALQLVFDAQRQLADSLHKAYPDRLDHVTAAAVIGAMWGAALAGARSAVEHGASGQQVIEAADRAIEIAMRGIDSVGLD